LTVYDLVQSAASTAVSPNQFLESTIDRKHELWARGSAMRAAVKNFANIIGI
jgi:hypothetical protein